MSTGYEFYYAALENSAEVGKSLPVHEGDPQAGFYRKRKFKGGPFVPVAIWRDGESMVALCDEKSADPAELWTFVCRNPITEAAYHKAVKTGEWDDVAPGVGHNSGDDDPFESLSDQIAAAGKNVATFSKIEDDEAQAKAQSARARLNELSNEADKIRKREKEPHFEAGKAVDAKWQPLVKDAKAGADAIAKAMGAYETEKARKAAEARRKAEEEARKREEERRAAEAAGKPAPEPEPAPISEPEPAPTTIKGGYGRAASVRVVRIVAQVTDWGALWGFLREHPELKDNMIRLAQRALDKGHEVPGVAVDEERRVA